MFNDFIFNGYIDPRLNVIYYCDIRKCARIVNIQMLGCKFIEERKIQCYRLIFMEKLFLC